MKTLDIEILSSKLTERNEKDIAEGWTTCSQIIVNQGGRRVYTAEYGTNGIHGDKLKRDATYRIASMTKPITVLAVLQQAEKGNQEAIRELEERRVIARERSRKSAENRSPPVSSFS